MNIIRSRVEIVLCPGASFAPWTRRSRAPVEVGTPGQESASQHDSNAKLSPPTSLESTRLLSNAEQ